MGLKNIFKIWIMVSVVLLAIIGYILLGTSVSLKYEVEEPKMMGMRGEDLDDKEALLNQLIFILKTAAAYLVVNIIIVGRWLFNNSMVNKT